ncbi:MAG: hypothetical protein RLZZ631_1294 [Cyanobacteriota bacterium]|jgi:hypothetical protein
MAAHFYRKRGSQKPGPDGLYTASARVNQATLQRLDYIADTVGISRMRVLSILIGRGIDELFRQARTGERDRLGWLLANDSEPTPSEIAFHDRVMGEGNW